jgi:hypothetical protein
VAQWNKRDLGLAGDHGWKCKPGNRIFVADRGAVRFDIPAAWVVVADADGIKLHDKQPPDDDVRLQLSVFYPPPGINWTGLPLATFLNDALDERDAEPSGDIIGQDPISHVLRPGMEAVWTEVRRVDPGERREARHRHLFARGKGTDRGLERDILTLITMDFWPEDAKQCEAVWKELVRSLRLGQFVADPRKGPQPAKRRRRG